MQRPYHATKAYLDSQAFNQLLEFAKFHGIYADSTEAKRDGFKEAIETATRHANEVLDDANCSAPECGRAPQFPDEQGWHWCHRHHDGELPENLDEDIREELLAEYEEARND